MRWHTSIWTTRSGYHGYATADVEQPMRTTTIHYIT